MSNTKSEKMKLAPVRSLSDFLLDTKKYSQPAFNDLKRFNNRISSNLLYYQTNYFIVSSSIFLLFLLFQTKRIIGGLFGFATTGAVILFTLDKIPQLSSLKRQYPAALYVAWGANLLITFTAFGSISFVLLVLLIPFLFWILHAAVRSRGIKNKISNKMEQIGAPIYTNTPMGFVLSSLGLEARDFEE